MSTLLLDTITRLTANGLSRHVHDHTIVFATVGLADDELGSAPNRALGAWCARMMLERCLCSFFRARVAAVLSARRVYVCAVIWRVDRRLNVLWKGGVLIAHDRANDTSTSRAVARYAELWYTCKLARCPIRCRGDLKSVG